MSDDQTEILIQNNELMYQMVQELREIKVQLSKQTVDVDTCGAEVAMKILGTNNPRYLTHFSERLRVLPRRKGGNGFLYYKSDCEKLAAKIKSGEVKYPTAKGLYQH